MALIPWTQQLSGARYGDQPGSEPPVNYETKEYGWPWEKRWWDEPWRGLFKTTPEGTRGEAIIPNWIRDIGLGAMGGLGGLSLSGGLASSGMLGTGTVGSGIGSWLGAHPLAGTLIGGSSLAGLLGMSGETPQSPPATPQSDINQYGGVGNIPYGPAQETTPESNLPQPGEAGADTGPVGSPQIVEVNGQKFWWNPTGGLYGAGGWDALPTSSSMGLTPEQQIEQARLDREAALERARLSAGLGTDASTALREQREWEALQSELERKAAMARLQEQMRSEYQSTTGAISLQAQLAKEAQAASAAQQMAQMYAADPYKYWAQLGQGTPEAVARLTGGQVAPGSQMGQVPLSVPSAQWWQNLLPSEQQQISGGLNWLGVNPEDWYSMYQRMIPGLGSRQVEPMWAR